MIKPQRSNDAHQLRRPDARNASTYLCAETAQKVIRVPDNLSPLLRHVVSHSLPRTHHDVPGSVAPQNRGGRVKKIGGIGWQGSKKAEANNVSVATRDHVQKWLDGTHDHLAGFAHLIAKKISREIIVPPLKPTPSRGEATSPQER